MSKPLAFGLNLKKPPAAGGKPAIRKPRAMFGGDSDSDDGNSKANGQNKVEAIGGDNLDDIFNTSSRPEPSDSRQGPKSKRDPPSEPPKLKAKKNQSTMFGDLSSSLTSRKNMEKATEVDSNVYEYDAVYDSLKPKKKLTAEEEERRPKYMKGLMQAAETRKRDALIAEEKKIAREREAEGEEYADKEKFVTAAYKRQQEENRKLEEEEKRKEEEEAKKNKGGGMSAFYREMLDRDQQKHADYMKAAEEIVKGRSTDDNVAEDEGIHQEKEEAEKVKKLQESGANIAVNEDGQVVDKRQLLKGGLNIDPNRKKSAQTTTTTERSQDRARREMNSAQFSKRHEMRERQSRMLAEQLEQAVKRSRDGEDDKRVEAERAAKSRKTDGEISSAKERYLARKKAAEEEKKKKESGET